MEFDFRRQPGLVRKIDAVQVEKPLISIITPFFNAGKYFEQTYNCVINQTFIWFEWIIVDDGSTHSDDLKILKSLVEKDNRIQVYHIKNGGPAAARNYAVSKTCSEIIVSLDADDLIEPSYLEQTYFALYFHPKVTWAYTDSLGFEQMQYVWKVPFDGEKLKKRNFLIEIGTFRKAAFLEAGGYDDAQKHSHEDWNLWLRFMAKGGFPVHIASLLSWYRIVNDGALHKTNDNKSVRKRAYDRIKEVAKQITEPIKAVEYPRMVEKEKWKTEALDLGLRKPKEKQEVLLFFSDLGQCEKPFYRDFINNFDTETFHIGIMSTEVSDNLGTLHGVQGIDDVYELPAFLDCDDYTGFISHYIVSRQVEFVGVCGSEYAGYLLPWLRKEFPALVFMNFTLEKTLFFKGMEYYFNKEFDIAQEKGIETIFEEIQVTLEKRGQKRYCSSDYFDTLADEYLSAYYKQLSLKWKVKRLEERLDWKHLVITSIKNWMKKQQY